MAEVLPLAHSWAWALAVCGLAAALEGVLASTGVKRRFAELRFPRGSLPLWAWSIVGFAYYALFFALLTSLLARSPVPFWTTAALGLVVLLLAANAAWNWVFFCRRDVRLSFVVFVAYAPVALALAVVLVRLDSPLSAWYSLYVAYLGYAAWWAYGVWQLNRVPEIASQL